VLPRLKKIIYQIPKQKFIRFSISGGIATVIDVSLLYFFTDIIGIWYLVSAILSFIVGSITHYLISRCWVFKSNSERQVKEFLSFFSIHTGNLIISIILLYLLVEYFHLWYILAKILTVAITVFTNFALQKKITFKFSN